METQRTIGRYEITRWIASGAMGEIYEARDPAIGRPVAIKLLRRELAASSEGIAWLERFRREVRAAGRRQHPNIVTVYDYGEENGSPFFVMEYVEGESLAERIKRSAGPLPLDEAVAIITQVLSALDFAHSNGIVHRDIKPSNILVTGDGVAKVADFGIARFENSDLTGAGDILGTPSYMAPEQLNGQAADHRADLFAVGALLFQALTGAKPFPGNGLFETLAKMETSGPEDICALNPAVSPALKAVIEKALAFDPAARYASAAEFAGAISAACGAPRLTGAAPAPNDRTEIRPPPRPRAAVPAYRATSSNGPETAAHHSGATRRLAAILAADVAGYSRLMSFDEEDTLERLKSYRRGLIDPSITGHRGRIVKTTGDGLLAEFASAVEAVRCAVELQNGLADLNAPVPPDRRIEFRIGINVGDVIADNGDLYGDGVNVAARLEALAEPGSVLVSGSVHDHVQGKLRCEFHDRGEQQVKNIPRPVHVYRVSSPPAVSAPSEPVSPDRPSIAVLPFQNLSGDAAQDLFADGIVEEIITALSRIPSLYVVSRNSSARYKGRPVDVREVARELGVRYVLEGSVRRAGNRLRVNGQLIEAPADLQLWADRFDGGLDEGFDFQDRVAQAILAGIGTRFPTEPEGAGGTESTDGINIATPLRRPASDIPEAASRPPDAATGSGKSRRAGKRMLLSGIAAAALVGAVLVAIFIAPNVLNPLSPDAAAPQSSPPPEQAGIQPPAPPPSPSQEKIPVRDAISARLAAAVPSLGSTWREEAAQLYAAAKLHKAQAAAPGHTGLWRTDSRPSAEIAETAALENCQVFYGEPCVLLAVDDTPQPVPDDGKWPRRDMPRARYAGSFDPAQIPSTTPATRKRLDIVNYPAASAPKAAAFHPNGGRVFIVTGAASQYAAEEQALRVCNTDRPSYNTSGPCFLYASGDTVVLAKRLVTPLAQAPAAAPASGAPAEAPFDPEKVPFVKNREDVRRYAAARNAKSLAISTSGISWWMPTQRQALEACEFYARHPCILYAVQDRAVDPDGIAPPRPVLGPGEGRFDPTEVPFVSSTARQTLSVYPSTPNPKALAVSPRGNYGMAGDADSVEEAQRLALERCQKAEDDSAPPANRKPCYVYAVEDAVVLARRATAPIPPER